MRVALLISARHWRGSGVSFAKIAAGLIDRGLDAHLITAHPPVTARIRTLKLPVTEIPIRSTGWREVRALTGLLTELNADVLVTDKARDLRIAALAGLFHPILLVHRYNGTDELPRADWRDQAAISRAAAVVFMSEHSERLALQSSPWMAGTPRFRIANGVDSERFRPNSEAGGWFREKWGIAPGSRVVLTSAHFAPTKRHDLILAALAKLPAHPAPLVFVACGTGPLVEAVRIQAHAVGVTAVFPGALGVDELVAGLNAADVLVHAAEQETFGNAVAEGMACGKAVVAVAAGAVPEVLGTDGVSGVLVPPNNPAALSQAIHQLLEDSPRRRALGNAARQRVEREFSLARMADEYTAMLKAL